MIYTIDYSSPLGKMLIAAGDGGIRGLHECSPYKGAVLFVMNSVI